MDTNMVYGEDDEAAEEAAEGYTEEEEAMDLAALADVVCRKCNKKGHFARSCKVPPGIRSGWQEERQGYQVREYLWWQWWCFSSYAQAVESKAMRRRSAGNCIQN